MNTRRYPRTLEEAFGPYTSRDFIEPVDWRDSLVVAACALAAVGLAAILLIWG